MVTAAVESIGAENVLRTIESTEFDPGEFQINQKKRNKGYGAFCYRRKGVAVQGRAHRYSWEVHRGAIPEGMCVLHNCPDGDNPACVNPDHLYLGTKAVNNADCISKGRYNHKRTNSGRYGGSVADVQSYKRGESHPASRLSADDVTAIRAARQQGESFGSLSRRLGISIGHIFRIVNKTAWAHV